MTNMRNTIPGAFGLGGDSWDQFAQSLLAPPARGPLASIPVSGSSNLGGLWKAIAQAPVAPGFSGLVPVRRPVVPPIALAPSAPAPAVFKWAFVTRRFDQIIENLGMLQGRIDDGNTKQASVRACLNRYYWGNSSETANSLLVGSWAKTTRVRPSNDIDVMFILPNEVYSRFQQRSGNRQSQLLQEVRGVLSETFSSTDMRGDGQVVVIKFSTIPVEVVPAFRCSDGSLIICDTKNEGRYKAADPTAELAALDGSDNRWHGNTRALARMMKKWQQYRDVKGLKSFQLERLAVEFLSSWGYSHESRFYYDWMVRDFFYYLLGRRNTTIRMPGTGESVALGAEWLGEALRAYRHANAACVHEQANREVLAGQAWQEIFGAAAPVSVS